MVASLLTKSSWFVSCAVFMSVTACSSSAPLTPYQGRGRSDNLTLPGGNGQLGGDALGSGEARFVQTSAGTMRVDLGSSNRGWKTWSIFGGNMVAKTSPDAVEMTISGLSTNADEPEAQTAINESNGTTRFNRVTYSNLPKQTQYTNHPYFIFASSVTNAKGETFRAVDGNPFPVFPVAKDTIDSFANIQTGAVTYYSEISNGATQHRIKFQVQRVIGSMLSGCDSGLFAAIVTMLSDPNYFALQFTVFDVPDDWAGRFPMSDSVFVMRFGNGGLLSRIGVCKRAPFNKRGQTGAAYSAMEFTVQS